MKVWIICPQKEHYTRVQSLRALVSRLSLEKQFKVTLFIGIPSSNEIVNSEDVPDAIKVVNLPFSDKKASKRGLDLLVIWRRAIRESENTSPPDTVIAIDKFGLLVAGMMRTVHQHRLWYFNYELRVQKETPRFTRKLVLKIEAYLHRQCTHTLIQDNWRATFIRDEHHLEPEHRFLLIPNSPRGNSSINKTNYLRDKYTIQNNDLVLLYIGSLTSHFMAAELVDSFEGFTGATLVIHSPRATGDSKLREYIKEKIASMDNAYLSEEMLNTCDMEAMIRSANIGIGFFKPVAGNYVNEILMGYASGKLAQYLQCGIPILTSNYPSMQWVEKSGCGKVTVSVTKESLRTMVSEVSSNYDIFSRNSAEFFDDTLALNGYLDEIIRNLSAVSIGH